jgi:NAD(P)-dependent dehydrogenase (short-subunit alcohol dehydrogenase family)
MAQRTWFITGVNSGFGRHLSEQLLERGDRVAGTIQKDGSVDDLIATYGDQFWTAHLDVTDVPAIKAVVGRAFTQVGRIDVIVSNAGYGLFGAAEELTDDQIDHVIATNLTGSIQLIRATLPHLRAQHGGRIIQIFTFGGQAAFAGASMYHATKWGIEGFAEAVGQEVAPFGIGVTIVEPGGAQNRVPVRQLPARPAAGGLRRHPGRRHPRRARTGHRFLAGRPGQDGRRHHRQRRHPSGAVAHRLGQRLVQHHPRGAGRPARRHRIAAAGRRHRLPARRGPVLSGWSKLSYRF